MPLHPCWTLLYTLPYTTPHPPVHPPVHSHLARKFVEMLATNQPYLNITPADMLCVEMAGLIHDLGHGIYSHLFDHRFLARYENKVGPAAAAAAALLRLQDTSCLPPLGHTPRPSRVCRCC